jgi:serine/threonine protein kinase
MTPFSDIWSLGVILYKIIFKMHPITPINVRMLDKKINEFYNGNFQINYPQTPESKKYRPIV